MKRCPVEHLTFTR